MSGEARRREVVDGGDAVLAVLRYVERNPLRAGLVRSAERWRWSSLHWLTKPSDAPGFWRADGYPRGEDWLSWVNEPQSEAELAALRRCVQRGARSDGRSG